MSYDSNEPIFPPGVPEEYKAQILEHRRTYAAHTQDNTHGVRMLLDDLSADQLKALDLIIVAILENPDYNAAYFRGQITTLLHLKFDVCPCGQDHDPTKALQLPEITRPGAPVVPNSEPLWKGREVEDVDLPDDYNPDNSEREVPWEPVPDGPEVYARHMEKYGLLEDEQGIYCRNCGTRYVSLEDRMLKEPGPGGCDGCQQQEKWG